MREDSSLQVRTDGCHGRAAVALRARIDAYQGRAFDRANPELAIVASNDLSQLLSAIFGIDAQDERFGTHPRNKRVHIRLPLLWAIIALMSLKMIDVGQNCAPAQSTVNILPWALNFTVWK